MGDEHINHNSEHIMFSSLSELTIKFKHVWNFNEVARIKYGNYSKLNNKTAAKKGFEPFAPKMKSINKKGLRHRKQNLRDKTNQSKYLP